MRCLRNAMLRGCTGCVEFQTIYFPLYLLYSRSKSIRKERGTRITVSSAQSNTHISRVTKGLPKARKRRVSIPEQLREKNCTKCIDGVTYYINTSIGFVKINGMEIYRYRCYISNIISIAPARFIDVIYAICVRELIFAFLIFPNL